MFTRTPSKLLNGASQSDGRGGDLGLQAKVETKGKQVWSDSELREEKRPGLADWGWDTKNGLFWRTALGWARPHWGLCLVNIFTA